MCLTFGYDGQNGHHGGGGDVENDGDHNGEQSQTRQQDFPCKNFPDRTCNRDIVKFATKVLKTAILIAMSHERKNLNLYLAKYIFT